MIEAIALAVGLTKAQLISILSVLFSGGFVVGLLKFFLGKKKLDHDTLSDHLSQKQEMMKYADEVTRQLQENLMNEITRLQQRIIEVEKENAQLRKIVKKHNLG